MFEIEILRVDLVRSNSDELNEESDSLGDKLRNREIEIDGKSISPYALRRDSQPGFRNILLKGQMLYLNDIIGIIYLCSPV